MYETLHVVWFVLSIIVILTLFYQLNENAGKGRENKHRDQDRITKASRLIIQSANQTHPYFALSHALESKFILDDVIQSYGGVGLTEKQLGLQPGALETLLEQVNNQTKHEEQFMMAHIIKYNDLFDISLNTSAKLNPSVEPKKRARHEDKFKFKAKEHLKEKEQVKEETK